MSEDSEKNNGEQKTFAKWLKKNLLLVITMSSVFLGIGVGLGLREAHLSDSAISLIGYPGELYMRALKLLVLPLVISSLITGSSSVNAKLNGKIALRTLLIFFVTSAVSALLGVVLAIIIHPGNQEISLNDNKLVEQKQGISVWDSLLDLGRNIVSDNIFESTFQQAYTDYKNVTVKVNDSIVSSKIEKVTLSRPGTNNIGIVFFCIIFGTMLGMLGPKGQVVKDFFAALFDVVIKMVKGVIWATPVGLFSIITAKLASITNLTLVISQLGKFIATVISGLLFWQFIVMPLLYFVVIRKNPYKFYVSLLHGTLTAFAASSSSAALPIYFDIMDNEMKINPAITKFVLPIGCQIHLDGAALFLAVSTIFQAQINGFYLSAGTYVTIWLSATVMSFSMAAIPSASLVLLLMIMSSIGIPLKEFSLMFVVDWILDRARTTNNVLGDCYTVVFVQKMSKDEFTESLTDQDPEEENKLVNKEDQVQVV